MPGLLVVPEVVLAAATELDLLAERLAAVNAVNSPVTHTIPAGVEEVSVLASTYFNRAAATNDASVAQAILELHHAAATLRLQLAEYLAQDAVNAFSNAAVNAAFI